jgi:NADH-ubiquinone oxidoreductase chain 4
LGWWVRIIFLVLVVFIVLVRISNNLDFIALGRIFISDFFGFILIYLRVWVTLLIIIARFIILKVGKFGSYFLGIIIWLNFILTIRFLTSNLFVFYFFFESSLIPTLIIILGWGGQSERLQAGLYFMFYTLTASLPLLIGLMYYYSYMGNVYIIDFITLKFHLISGREECSLFIVVVVGLILIFAFLVKTPIFLTHLWLGKAHVEAPVAGSMILAGVLLKLGGYGLWRVSIKLFWVIDKLGYFIIGLRLVAIIHTGIICCRLNDLRMLVAYSSVAHIAFTLCGLFRYYHRGIKGMYLLLIGHGFTSSGLFCLVNVYYDRIGRRRIYLNKGLINIIPIYRLMAFILISSNISAPPSISLLSEISLIIRIESFWFYSIGLIFLRIMCGTVFSIYLYSYGHHRKVKITTIGYNNGVLIEIHSLLIHLLPIYLFVLFFVFLL